MREDDLSAIDGTAFVVSDALAAILPTNGHGFFRADTRFLSALALTVNGQRPLLLRSGNPSHSTVAVYATNPPLGAIPAESLTLLRERSVDGRLDEALAVTNHGPLPAELEFVVEVRADFADLFEVRGLAPPGRCPSTRSGRRSYALRFDSRRAGMRLATVVRSSLPAEVDGTKLRYRVRLAPRATWQVALKLERHAAQPAAEPPGRLPALHPRLSMGTASLPEPRPTLTSEFAPLERAYQRAIRDLAALRVEHGGHVLPAAGLPWFMAIFGRDSLITSLQTLALDPDLARGALRVLAEYQASAVDPFRDAEPGKIPHEIRHGRLSRRGTLPHGRYYGTVDATPLYLLTLAETVRWTGDLGLARELLPAAEAALGWIDHYGDRDGDGFVENERRSPHGLDNQGWKDSHDSVRFADGRPASGPIALCEVQGYVYAAKRSMARLYRRLGLGERAAQLRAEAARLRRRFNDRFWLPEREVFALGLDGDKRPIDAVSSNAGQCLWSGIAEPEKAARLAGRLLAEDLFSGWGVRTLSAEMAAYNPVSYHNGSVWPHDNALIAAGLARYGHAREASRIIRAQFEAASHFPDHRLPELFAGFPRREDHFLVNYLHANAPQAWAAGAVILMLQTWPGL